MKTSARTATAPKRGLVQEGRVQNLISSLGFWNRKRTNLFDFSAQGVAGS